MNEERVQLLTARLLSVLAAELSPDAAGSRAIALALIAVQAEEASESGTSAADPDDLLARDMYLLPAFIAQAQDACDDDLVTLVRRFVQGERPRSAGAPTPPDPARSARHAQLRELRRWGVDLSLIETTMAQTPTVRIVTMERQLLVRQLQRAKREQAAADE